MDTTISIREDLPNLDDMIIDAEIWKQDSDELNDMAETLVNRHPRFAWMVVDAWLTKHGQLLIDKN
jgi:3-methyladenine DNA glycosylase AlkC